MRRQHLLLALLVSCRPSAQEPPALAVDPPRLRIAPTRELTDPRAAAGPFAVVGGLPPVVEVTTLADDPASRGSSSLVGACARTGEGEVWCWRFTEARDPTDVAAQLTTTPKRMWRSPAAEAISGPYAIVGGMVRSVLPWVPTPAIGSAALLAGEGGACAIRPNGRVNCWYDGAPWDDAASRPEVGMVRRARAVSVGTFGACAVEASGELVCWGAASLIGWEPLSPHSPVPPPTPPTPLREPRDVAHVSLSGDMPCLARHSGEVLCWFPEDALTLLPNEGRPTLLPVLGVADAVGLVGDLVLRNDATLARIDRTYDEDAATVLTATTFGAGVLGDVVKMTGSATTGCATTKRGTVFCWTTP